jgi:hypothetical protein
MSLAMRLSLLRGTMVLTLLPLPSTILFRAVGQNVTWSRYQSDFDELLQNKDLKPHDMQQIMFTPHIAEGVVGTVTHEYLMSDHVRRALFLCARQRFIDDTETSVKIPPDFDFALYLTMRISSILVSFGVVLGIQCLCLVGLCAL